MNVKAKKGQLSFYMLLCLLYAEAMTVKLQVCLDTENKLSRIECRKYRRAQAAIFKVWDDYLAGNKTANQLLKACSKLVYAPN